MGGLLRLDGGARLLDAVFLAQGTQNFWTAKAVYMRPSTVNAQRLCALTIEGPEERRGPVRERYVPSQPGRSVTFLLKPRK